MLRERHKIFRAVLIASDALFVLAAQVAAYGVRFGLLDSVVPDPTYWELSIPLVLMPLMIVALLHAGLYRPRRDQRFSREAVVIIRAVVIGTVLVMAASYFFKKGLTAQFGTTPDLSRLQFGLFGTFTIVNLLAWRFTFRSVLRALRRRGWNLRHVAIVGTGRLGQVVYHTLTRNTWTGIKPAFFISHASKPELDELCGLPVAGGVNDFERIFSERDVSGVFIAIPQRMAARLPKLLATLERFPFDVRVVPDVNPRYTPFSMQTSELDGMPILSVRENPQSGWGFISKRIVDVAGAVTGVVLFAPLMLVIALAVRLSGPGPIVFRQPRASLAGRRFMMYKFRTMRHASHEQQALHDVGKGMDAWTEVNDPRITKVGRLLRRTSLDELPQLFNVILGEMSLVGPRPERPELISRFREDWRGYMLRQHVKAGMTGWAQVNGLRGKSSLRKRLQYDLFYIRHWSLAFDLRILWLTVFRGFVNPNAQ